MGGAPTWRVLRVGLWGMTVAYLLALAFASAQGWYEPWTVLVILPALVGLTVPLVLRQARDEGPGFIVPFAMSALIVRLVAGVAARIIVNFDVYEGVADAVMYDTWGEAIARSLREGDLVVDVGGPLIGTGFIRLLTGVVYTITGPTSLGGFLVYSWFSFVGLFLFYRAFTIAMPFAERRRYAVLVLLLPSLLYWPSSIGKDAWVLLGLGTAVCGAAHLYRRSGGLVLLLLGTLAVGVVRPHVAAMLVAAVAIGVPLRAARRPGTPGASRLVAVAMLLLALLVLGSPTERFLAGRFGTETLSEALDFAADRTDSGNSGFEASRVRSPADLPGAAIALLFRPFPHEATGGLMILASFEGVGLMLAFAIGWRRAAAFARRAVRDPFAAMAIAFTLLFVIGFSTFGNLGIIARQRVQVLPFVLVVLAFPLPATKAATPSVARDTSDKELLTV